MFVRACGLLVLVLVVFLWCARAIFVLVVRPWSWYARDRGVWLCPWHGRGMLVLVVYSCSWYARFRDMIVFVVCSCSWFARARGVLVV